MKLYKYYVAYEKGPDLVIASTGFSSLKEARGRMQYLLQASYYKQDYIIIKMVDKAIR